MRVLSDHDLPSRRRPSEGRTVKEAIATRRGLWATIGACTLVAGGLTLLEAHGVSNHTKKSIADTVECSSDHLAQSDNPMRALIDDAVVLETIDFCADQQDFVLQSSVRLGLVDDVRDELRSNLFPDET